MKKLLALLMAVLTLTVLMTGCVSMDIGVKLNEDETGTVTATLGIKESFYETLKSTGSDPFDGHETITFKKGEDTYIGYAEVKSFDSFENMEKDLISYTYNTDLYADSAETNDPAGADNDVILETADGNGAVDNHIFKDVSITKEKGAFNSKYHFSVTMNPMPKESDGYDTNELFSVSLSVEMPGKITDIKGGKAEDGKIVFDIGDITEETTFEASSQSSGNTGVIVVAIVALIIVAGCIVLFVKNRKRV